MRRNHLTSQHFLRKPQTVKTLIGHSTIKKSDTVIDLGAGSGIISFALSSFCAQVVAVEQDPRMVKKLHENLDDIATVTIVESDILTYKFPQSPFKVFSNIPFHLSSPILRKLTELDNPPQAIYLIVQRQFAEKLIINGDSFTGLLGAMIAPRYTTRIRYKLVRSDYSPPPAVDTVLVELLLRKEPLVEMSRMLEYRNFVELCFSRQKFFERFHINKRPSQLSAQQWVTLFDSQKNLG
jgi:23S rRNA (adenine-N6)-dimethyltransferase